MIFFLQQTLSGIASGSLFAMLGLAIVLIHRSTGVLNFAQGEMALIATFVAWSLLTWSGNPWLATVGALLFAGLLGALLYYWLFRHVQRAGPLPQVMLAIGVYMLCGGALLQVWGAEPRTFGPFPLFQGAPFCAGGLCISRLDVGTLTTALFVMSLLDRFLRHTKLGKALRATTEDPLVSSLMGIPVARMFALGWGLSSAVGALAGLLAAQGLGLDTSTLSAVLLLAFAGAVLGGLESPPGAVMGGLLVGVLKNWAGAYAPAALGNLDLTLAFLLIVLVLLARPEGLLGQRKGQKV